MKRLMEYLNRHDKQLLWLFIISYFLIFSTITIWKYFHLGYNSLDLAIFNQVFFNSSHGDLWQMTIHPNLYLGDHFALIIPLLVPIYSLFRNPLNLLIMQTAILALTTLPIFLIAKKILAKPWPLVIALIWLLSPYVQNINLFEFHLLPLATFLVFWTFYFYQIKKFGLFLTLACLSLLVREDVALTIFMFSILALIDKRSLKWKAWPSLISTIYFIIALKFISFFTPTGSYKFIKYYAWLGDSLSEMMINFFSQPLNTLGHILALHNIVFTLALLMPLAFVSLFRPKYLLISLLVYTQFILGPNPTIVLQMHYTSLLLPGIFIAFIFGLQAIFDGKIKWLSKYKELSILILALAVIYSFVTMGPILGIFEKTKQSDYAKEVLELKKELLSEVGDDKSLAATYEFLTPLSGRPKIYSLHYAFMGQKQLSNLGYGLPADLDMLVVDFNDFLVYQSQLDYATKRELYLAGDDRLRKIIKDHSLRLTRIIDTLAIFEKNGNQNIELYQTASQFDDIKNSNQVRLEGIEFLGWSNASKKENNNILPISLYFKAQAKLDRDYQIKLIIKDGQKKIIHQKFYPLAYGLYPGHEWQAGEKIKINYWFLMPKKLPLGSQLELSLVNLNSYTALDRLRTTILKIKEKEDLGVFLNLEL